MGMQKALEHVCQNLRPVGQIRPNMSFDVAYDSLKGVWLS